MKKIKVAVLCGGISSEREISLKSGEQVARNLPRDKYDVRVLEISKDNRWLLRSNLAMIGKTLDDKRTLVVSDQNALINQKKISQKVDVVFIALHGKYGEDGRIQALLDLVGVPYTGSKVLASALGMNKIKANDLVEKYGIRVPKTLAINKSNFQIKKITADMIKQVGFPCVIKPNESGSSVGITIVKNQQGLRKAFSSAFKEDDTVLVQKYIQGREITCGVLGNSSDSVYTSTRIPKGYRWRSKLIAMPPVEIISDNEFFDYNAKYFSKKTQEICPAKISKKSTKEVKSLAKKVHQTLGCDGLTRSDFILTPQGKYYFLEINTIPGLTEASLCPKEARAMGWSFSEFLDRQIQLALEK